MLVKKVFLPIACAFAIWLLLTIGAAHVLVSIAGGIGAFLASWKVINRENPFTNVKLLFKQLTH